MHKETPLLLAMFGSKNLIWLKQLILCDSKQKKFCVDESFRTTKKTQIFRFNVLNEKKSDAPFFQSFNFARK